MERQVNGSCQQGHLCEVCCGDMNRLRFKSWKGIGRFCKLQDQWILKVALLADKEYASMTNHNEETRRPSSGSIWTKMVLVGVAGMAVAICYWNFGDALSLTRLAQHEAQLRTFQEQHPLLVYGIAFLVYVLVTGLSLPGASALSLAYGWYFGSLRGVIVVSISSTAGATMAFLLCRYLFREAIQRRFGDRLHQFNENLRREGPFFLFSLRLIPAIPFFVINAVMGLTPMRTRTFWWVSQLGMLPATVVYVYAGSSVPSLQMLAEKGVGAVFSPWQLAQLLAAFGALGAFPLAVRGAAKVFLRRRARVT